MVICSSVTNRPIHGFKVPCSMLVVAFVGWACFGRECRCFASFDLYLSVYLSLLRCTCAYLSIIGRLSVYLSTWIYPHMHLITGIFRDVESATQNLGASLSIRIDLFLPDQARTDVSGPLRLKERCNKKPRWSQLK